MLHDTTRIKESYDLRCIVEQDLGQPPVRSGQAHLYKCPFHNERKGYSLVVWADGYRCFGKCDTSGDLFDWLLIYRRLSFSEALAALGEDRVPAVKREARPIMQSIATEPPSHDWQTAAREVVSIAEDALWSSEGERALTYLLERGLSTKTIRDARLGFIPGDFREWREIAGLNVPCGITIPWLAADALWAVKVRRAYGDPKYVQIAGGSSHGLYNADRLHTNQVALFCEGEFDTLLVQQEASCLVSPVTLGSAAARLTARWYGELVGHRTILVAYDRDEAGRRGTERLLKLSRRFKSMSLPEKKDITDFYLGGGDLYTWIAAALPELQLEVMPHAR